MEHLICSSLLVTLILNTVRLDVKKLDSSKSFKNLISRVLPPFYLCPLSVYRSKFLNVLYFYFITYSFSTLTVCCVVVYIYISCSQFPLWIMEQGAEQWQSELRGELVNKSRNEYDRYFSTRASEETTKRSSNRQNRKHSSEKWHYFQFRLMSSSVLFSSK